jgi:peptidoglycan hydrolase-like protein with peptidoglycan-binding domain
MTKPAKTIRPVKAGLTAGARGDDVLYLQSFLKAFGYLQLDAPETDNFGALRDIGLERPERGSFDEVTENALKRFQAFYGLRETGKVDDDTAHLMQRPRCGCPDNPSRLFRIQAAPGVGAFVAQGNRWSTPNVTYSFSDFTGDLTQQVIINNVREAFRIWSTTCNLTFTEVAGTGDIAIRFVTGDHGDGSPFDGAGNVLAHGFYPPPNGGAIAGDLHFDDAETWTTNNPPTGIDLLTVAIHEIGHTLGLDHSAVANAVMFAFYGGIRRALHDDDVAGISSIYGAATAKATLRDTSITSPSFCTLNAQGFLAWTGTNAQRNLNVMRTDNLRVMYGKVILGDTSLSGPALAAFNGRLYIAWRGVGNNRLNVMSSADGVTWQNKVTLTDTTFFRPALGILGGRLVMGWTGTDAQRRLNIIQSTDGTNWGNKITLGETSIEGPELCSFGSNLLLTWTGTDAQRRVNVVTFDGTSWLNKVTLGETSIGSPSIENVDGRIILGWTGTDAANRLNTLVSSNGVNFLGKVTYAETSFFGPSIAGFGATPLLLWTGKDTARSLNLLRI